MTETEVKAMGSSQMTEEKDNLRDSTAFSKSCLEDLQLLFQRIERSPDSPGRDLLETSLTWSQISSPTLEVFFQTDESSCSNTSRQSVGLSESDGEADVGDDTKEDGYEADISDLLDDENADN